ncbi:hypothetical protein HYV57_05075 [Candidatus Peregrinibacteria bacterium]|nr:hypothetical protein [Candidatus Peregrinibacteria bacterium]
MRFREPTSRHRRDTPREFDDIHGRTPGAHEFVVRKPHYADLEQLDAINEAVRDLSFIEENMDFTIYNGKTPHEKGLYFDKLKSENATWIEIALNATDAIWIKVVEGRVVAAGKDLNDMPDDIALYNEAKSTGKVPFVFTNQIREPGTFQLRINKLLSC